MKVAPWHLVVALAAVILLVFALSIENIEAAGSTESIRNSIFSAHSLILFSTELSFALIIALLISLGIDRQARNADNALYDNMRKIIAEDVFKGVFSQNLPQSYIAAVIDKNLKIRSIRSSMKAIENLREIDEDILDTASPLRQVFIQVDRVLEYTLENISGQDIIEEASFFGPVNHPELVSASKITKLVVDGREMSQAELRQRRQLTRNDTTVLYEWPISISKDGNARIVLEATLFKERRDSDYWSMNYPTLRFELMMRSEMPLSKAGYLERTSASVTSDYVDAERGIISCIIEGPMLPNDSMAYWWSVA